MPTEELERTAEAARRALPELAKLYRYDSEPSLGATVPPQIVKKRSVATAI